MPPPLRACRRPGVIGIASLMRWLKCGKMEKGVRYGLTLDGPRSSRG